MWNLCKRVLCYVEQSPIQHSFVTQYYLFPIKLSYLMESGFLLFSDQCISTWVTKAQVHPLVVIESVMVRWSCFSFVRSKITSLSVCNLWHEDSTGLRTLSLDFNGLKIVWLLPNTILPEFNHMSLIIVIKVKNSLFHIKQQYSDRFRKKIIQRYLGVQFYWKSEQIKLHTAPKLWP